MLPSRGAKRITLRLNNKQESCDAAPPSEASNKWTPLPDASQPPVRDLTPRNIRSPSRDSPAPIRRTSMWRTGHEGSPSSKSDKQEAVKSQLESITGRMFALLNDYEDEDPQSKTYIDSLSEQVNQIPNPELRGNMQLMLQDYNEVCIERDELLFSLQDWFEQGHIDDMLQEVSDSCFSFSGDPEALRKSLLESKAASERLKVVKDKIRQEGGDDSRLIQEKDELERELLKSKTVFDALKGNREGQGTNQEVAHSWKFAAGEIFSVLTKVRNDGLVDLHELESQVKRLVDTIDQQSTLIGTLKDEVQQQRELVKHEELLKQKLAEENDLLSEEVKDVTQRMDEYCKKWRAGEEQVKLQKKAATERRCSVAASQKPASTAVAAQVGTLQLQVDQLKGQCETLEQETATHKREKEELSKLVQELQDQLSGVEEESTALPKIQHVAPGRLVSASTGGGGGGGSGGGGGGGGGGEGSKRKREKVVSARVEEENFAKLRQAEEQLLAAREDGEQAAAKVREMSQDLQDIKEENAHLQQGVALLEAEYDHLQQQYSFLQNKMKELQSSHTNQTGEVTTRETPSTPITQPKREGREPSPEVSEGEVVVDELVDGEAELTDEESGKAASLQLVVQMMQKLNDGSGEFDEADSTSLNYINKEMHRICADIQTFLEYSTDLVSKEANIVSEATGSLQMKLQEAGGSHPSPSPSSPSTPGHTGPSQEMRKGGVVVEESASRVVACAGESSGQISRQQQQQQQQPTVEQDLQARVLCIGQQAMDALKASEKAFTQSIADERKKLTSVLQAMAEHKRRQPKSWQFPVSKEEGLFLDTRTHHLKINRKPPSLLAWQQRLRNLVSRQGGEGLVDLPTFLRGEQYGRIDTPAGFGSRAHMYSSGAEENIGRGRTFAPMVIRGTRTTSSYSGESSAASAAKASRAKPNFTRTHPLGGKGWRRQQRKNHFQFGTDEPDLTYSGGLEAGIAGKHQLVASLPLIRQQNGRVEQSSHRSPTGLSPIAQEPDKRAYLDLVSHTISPFAQNTRSKDSGRKGQQQRARGVKLPDIHT